jgi:hypothetical protein
MSKRSSGNFLLAAFITHLSFIIHLVLTAVTFSLSCQAVQNLPNFSIAQ